VSAITQRGHVTESEPEPVKILHPDWDDTAVKAEVAAILAETGAAVPDPVGHFPLHSPPIAKTATAT